MTSRFPLSNFVKGNGNGNKGNDVTSLFTNIPLQETIDIAINLIFNHDLNLKLTTKELKKTFPFCCITDSTYF